MRDIQELIGRLVDDGTADPRRIGVTGDSYGGGQSLMLAALRDRVMLPDGSLIPWRSPGGTPLRIAAAAPVIPWTDLVNAAAPNGRVSSTGITPRSVATDPVGVEKASVVNAIFAAAQFATGPGQPTGEPFVPGRPMGFLAPTGLDPDADVAGWVTRTSAGEPYDDASAQAIVDTLARLPLRLLRAMPSHRPPPLYLASGLTDDLFPADETLRYANRTAKRYPGLPIATLLGDFGHQRASNEPAERKRLLRVDPPLVRPLPARPRPPPAYGRHRVRADLPARGARRAPLSRAHASPTSHAALSGSVIPSAQTVSSTGIDAAGGAALDPVSRHGRWLRGRRARRPGRARRRTRSRCRRGVRSR